MAMSDTTSNMAQWAGLYHGPGPVAPAGGGGAADSTVVTTTATSSPTSAGSPTRIEGRAGKSARRRSRASRRAPVTLLNTDTTNFRAMVQQFTGIPSGPYAASGAMAAGPVISFGADYGMRLRPSPAPVMSFDHLHQQQQQPPSFHDQLFRPQQQYSEAAGFMQGQGSGSGHDDVFAHGFGAEDRMFLESMQAAQMLPMHRPASTNNATNGYFG